MEKIIKFWFKIYSYGVLLTSWWLLLFGMFMITFGYEICYLEPNLIVARLELILLLLPIPMFILYQKWKA